MFIKTKETRGSVLFPMKNSINTFKEISAILYSL